MAFSSATAQTICPMVAGEEDVHKYYPEGTKWTEIRLDTSKYNSWYSRLGDEWVPNFETIEYYVQGEFVDKYGDTYKCVYTNGPEWKDSLTLLVHESNGDIEVTVLAHEYDGSPKAVSPCEVYQFDWSVGQGLYFRDICESNTTSEYPYNFYYGIIDEIKEGDFGGVRPLKYVDLDGKAPYNIQEPGNTDTGGGRIIQGIGITEWNNGECLFGPPNPYQALRFFDYYYGDKYPERHYRSMLVHFERDDEVLYDVWPRKGSTVEVAIDGLNYFLNLKSHEATITYGHTCSGELDIPSEVSYNEETFVVKSMISSAFHSYKELTKVRIPKTIENILNYYPYDPDWLDSPTGEANPIYMNPFTGCIALESIEVDEENPSLKSVDGVLFSQDGLGQYYYKTGSYSGTGLYCYPEGARQESYTIPENVEWIGGAAFAHNQYLTTLTIPNSTKHICYDAFSGCGNLTDVYCKAEDVPIAWDGAFRNVPIASATLHVPAGSVEKYKTTSPWSGFGNIVALPEEPARPLPFLEGNPIWVFKSEHIPTPRSSDWMKYWVDTGDRHYTYYFLGKQKEIDGKAYTMMGEVGCSKEGEITHNRWYPVREENGIVYSITDSLPGVVDYCYNDEYYRIPYLQQGKECVLYNFSAEIGDKLDENHVVKSFDTYQLIDGTVCRVLKTNGYSLYEKLGYRDDDGTYGVIDPLYGIPISTNGHAYTRCLNAYYQDDTMLYKAPDVQEGLCVNDTIWTTLDDAYIYARSYKADPYHEEVMAYIRQLQAANAPVTFTQDQMATIILPTAPDASKGKYYRLDRVEDNQIIFEQELQPQARVPYIIVPNEDFSIDPSTLNLEGLTQDVVSIEGISFIGSYVREELEQQEGSYIDIIDMTPDCTPLPGEGQGERLFIGALRAYLIVRWDDPYNPGGTKGPEEKMEIVLRDYGTGIDSLTPNPSPRRGELERRGEAWYDLQGRRLSGKPARGIYIKEGKKKVKN